MSTHRTGSFALTRTIEAMSPRVRPHDALTRLCDGALFGALGRPRETSVDAELDERLQQAYRSDLNTHGPDTDILGRVYMDLGSRGGRAFMGQFFSPQPIAELMAAMSLNLPVDAWPEDRLYRIFEPSSGSGVMLLAAIDHLVSTYGPACLPRLSVTAIDLDRLCALMTATQLVAQLSAVNEVVGHLAIFHGNSLDDPRTLRPIVVATHARHLASDPERAGIAAEIRSVLVPPPAR